MAGQIKRISNETVLKAEHGTIKRSGRLFIALGYPATYSVGASSLGFQTVYRIWNTITDLFCERFFIDTFSFNKTALTLESHKPAGNADLVAFSLACETDLAKTAYLLDSCGIPLLAKERKKYHPPVIMGGPLTLVDAKMMEPMADVIVNGEGEDALVYIAQVLKESSDKQEFLAALKGSGMGIWVTGLEECPAIYRVKPVSLPAIGVTFSNLAALKNLFLIEIARGCPHGCKFCLLARSGRFRFINKDIILNSVPDNAPGVGLVGAAVTDHPDLEEIVSILVDRKKRVSLSSMRADRLTDNLLKELKRGGLRTLTVAADGASQKVRDSITKGIDEEDLLKAAAMAKKYGLSGLKIYSMVGLPNETVDDIKDFNRMILELSKIIPVSIAVQAFVPKPNTPLSDAVMMDLKELKQRLALIKREAGKRVTVMPSSPKWSWIDWKLCNGGQNSAYTAIEAYKQGESFAAWKKSINKYIDTDR